MSPTGSVSGCLVLTPHSTYLHTPSMWFQGVTNDEGAEEFLSSYFQVTAKKGLSGGSTERSVIEVVVTVVSVLRESGEGG